MGGVGHPRCAAQKPVSPGKSAFGQVIPRKDWRPVLMRFTISKPLPELLVSRRMTPWHTRRERTSMPWWRIPLSCPLPQPKREKPQAFLDLYRMSSTINVKNPVINSPDKAASYLHSVMDQVHDKEAFVVAFLNTKNRVIDHEVVSLGTINSSFVHPREVFHNAIVNKANAVILSQIHPSGDLTPSSEDINSTNRLKETENLLGIQVLDHLIIIGINQHDVYSLITRSTAAGGI